MDRSNIVSDNGVHMKVEKRHGEVESFQPEKIKSAVGKAMYRTGTVDESLPEIIVDFVIEHLGDDDSPHVDTIHELVEDGLMDAKAFDIAREYITYRKENMPDIFRPRTSYKPFEYPDLALYVDAIQQSYWIVSEYNFTADIQDFRSGISHVEREAVRRSLLAISQIEVDVKNFWVKVGDRLPKPEIQEVGAVFGESEVRHSRAYSHLLEILGLNSDFKSVLEVPAIKKRVAYAKRALAKAKTGDDRDYLEAVLLFTLFIENVSLFSQFLVILQMNKERVVLSGISNVVSATSLEEQLHNNFGCDIVNTIRAEHPEWFDDEMEERVSSLVRESFEAEKSIIEWIFEEGELSYITVEETVEYIKNRFNTGLEQAGFNKEFVIDESLLDRTEWFDIQNSSTMQVDLFTKRPPNYTKFSKSFDKDSLF
jgi:ribonucleoside-diphosphate reductase beta chain